MEPLLSGSKRKITCSDCQNSEKKWLNGLTGRILLSIRRNTSHWPWQVWKWAKICRFQGREVVFHGEFLSQMIRRRRFLSIFLCKNSGIFVWFFSDLRVAGRAGELSDGYRISKCAICVATDVSGHWKGYYKVKIWNFCWKIDNFHRFLVGNVLVEAEWLQTTNSFSLTKIDFSDI